MWSKRTGPGRANSWAMAGLEDPELVAPISALYREVWAPWQNFFLPCLKLEQKWREGSHWRKRYEPPRTAYERLCAPGMLTLKAAPAIAGPLRESGSVRFEGRVGTKVKQILHPKPELIARPPKKPAWGFRPQGGASEGSKARPPARFSSQSNTQKYIKTQRPKHGSQTTGLLRTRRCLFPVSQRDTL